MTVEANSINFYVFRRNLFLRASVAQSVEQLIRNQQVEGSNPSAGSLFLFEWIIRYFFIPLGKVKYFGRHIFFLD